MADIAKRLRFLTNTKFRVTKPDGSSEERNFISNKYYRAERLLRYPDGYGEVHLSDGCIIKDIVLKDVVEPHGALLYEDVEEGEIEDDGYKAYTTPGHTTIPKNHVIDEDKKEPKSEPKKTIFGNWGGTPKE